MSRLDLYELILADTLNKAFSICFAIYGEP